MEIDLAAFFTGGGELITLFYVLGLSSAGSFIWLNNRSLGAKHGTITVIIQCLCRTWLDTALVAGISGTAIGMLGMLLNMDNLSGIYNNVNIALLTFFWGGILTGIAYTLNREDLEINYRLKPWQILVCCLFSFWMLQEQMVATGAAFGMIQTSLSLMYYYLPTFLLIFLVGYRGADSKILLANNANLLSTLGGMALGITIWFTEGADYKNSTDAIYMIATMLSIGCITYLGLYLFALSDGSHQKGNYQTKTWHFAEAAAFFIFLVYAPVGTTEYFRESTDQATQQANNEAQQVEINNLKAQIKLLTEKVGDV